MELSLTGIYSDIPCLKSQSSNVEHCLNVKNLALQTELAMEIGSSIYGNCFLGNSLLNLSLQALSLAIWEWNLVLHV